MKWLVNMIIFGIDIDSRLIAYAAEFGFSYVACDHDGLVFMSREKPEICTNKDEKWEFSAAQFWPIGFTDTPVKEFINLEELK